MTTAQQRLLKSIRKGKKFTISEIAASSGITQPTARVHVAKLIEHGAVECIKEGRVGRNGAGVYRRVQ